MSSATLDRRPSNASVDSIQPESLRSKSRHAVIHYREDGEREVFAVDSRNRNSVIRTVIIDNHLYDLHDLEQSHRFIIEPDWNSKVMWDSLVFVLIAYQVLIIPVELAFVDENTLSVPFNAWWLADFVMGLLFVIDLLVNCVTAFLRQDGLMDRNQRHILWNYALVPPFHMLIDVAALLPFVFGLVELGEADTDDASTDSSAGSVGKVSKSSRFFRYMRIFRVMRLLRLAKAMKFIRLLEKRFVLHGSKAILAASFMKIFLVVCCVVHVLACLWRAVSLFEDHAAKHAIDSQDVLASYSFSVWVAISTLSGSAPFEPGSIGEMWFTVLFLVISISLVNIFTAILVKMLDTFAEERHDLNKRLRIAKRFNSDRHLDQKLNQTVINAVKSSYLHERHYGDFKTEVEPLLSEDLRQRLHGQIYADLLQSFPPLSKQGDISMCSKLASKANEKIYLAKDQALKEDDVENSMVFVVEGQLGLLSDYYRLLYMNVCEKWFFGASCMLADVVGQSSKQFRRRTSLFALTKSILLEIDQKTFEEPDFAEWRKLHWQSVSKQDDIKEGVWGCPACREEGHWLDACEKGVPNPYDGKHSFRPFKEMASEAYRDPSSKARASSLLFTNETRDVDEEFDLKEQVKLLAASVKEINASVKEIQQRLAGEGFSDSSIVLL